LDFLLTLNHDARNREFKKKMNFKLVQEIFFCEELLGLYRI